MWGAADFFYEIFSVFLQKSLEIAQKSKKYDGGEFYLGRNSWDGYDIVERNLHGVPGEGACCFNVPDLSMGDGDGAPSGYNARFVCVGEAVREHAMRMFRNAEAELITEEQYNEARSFAEKTVQRIKEYLREEYECRR